MNTLLDLGLGFLIGLSLGLLGGGGSILTVPMLVYLFGQTPQIAVTASLAIVGANSVLGAFFHRAQGTLNWRIALMFGGVGMITAYLSAGWSQRFSPAALLVAFAVLMLAIGVMMLTRRARAAAPRSDVRWLNVVISGAGVGALTGLLGVGGGFLIVPALTMFIGLPMPVAVGTSLIVIALNSLAGLLGHLTGASLDVGLIATFVIAGLAGTFVGARLARRLSPDRLRAAFAVFVLILAVFLLYDNLPRLLI